MVVKWLLIRILKCRALKNARHFFIYDIFTQSAPCGKLMAAGGKNAD
jgi:hypothetical protein